VVGDAAVELPTPQVGSRAADWTVDPAAYGGSWPQFLERCSEGETYKCPGCWKVVNKESALWGHIDSGKSKCQAPPPLVLEQWINWYSLTFPSRTGKKRGRETPEHLPEGSRWNNPTGVWRKEAGFYGDVDDWESWHHIGWWNTEFDPGEHLVEYYTQNPCVEFPGNRRTRPQAGGSGRIGIGTRQRTH